MYNKNGRPIIIDSPILMLKRKKEAARRRVHSYVKKGSLKQLSCEYADCNILKTEAHHPDYDRPLDVLWLCKRHHTDLHKYIPLSVLPLDQYNLG